MAGAEAPKPVSMVTSAAQDPSHTVDSAKTIAIIGGSISGIHLAAKVKQGCSGGCPQLRQQETKRMLPSAPFFVSTTTPQGQGEGNPLRHFRAERQHWRGLDPVCQRHKSIAGR
mmetsp:Transcript_12835/g.46912  ORF Transcript_12835/g.46912 Transcript_12835/m.46912 type:complete len:114 (-) Transcript_12835:1801-2142(-)